MRTIISQEIEISADFQVMPFLEFHSCFLRARQGAQPKDLLFKIQSADAVDFRVGFRIVFPLRAPTFQVNHKNADVGG